MKKIYLNILLFTLATFSATVHAEQGAEKFLDAIIEVQITVPENARTAERFGTNRVASGVVIDKTGHILTIGFQTIEAETIEIVGKDPKTVNATVVGYDRNTGFGLLRAASPLQVTPMPLGNSLEVIERFSGAALIDRNGHLVGIGYLYSQLRIADLGLMPTNMFVPIDLLKPILSDLKLSGRSKLPSRPWLGVRTEEFYGRLVVERVVSDSPSEKAGIKSGDIILAVKKQEVYGMADFYRKVWALGKGGVDVPLSILQGVQIRNIVVHSTARSQYEQPVQKEKQTGVELL